MAACAPGGTGIQMAVWPSLWWLLATMTKTRLATKKVGSPWESFSEAPGWARARRRTRWIWSSAEGLVGLVMAFSTLAWVINLCDAPATLSLCGF